MTFEYDYDYDETEDAQTLFVIFKVSGGEIVARANTADEAMGIIRNLERQSTIDPRR